jgi:hypothetical protein
MAPPKSPVIDPGLWEAADFAGPEEWTLQLESATLAELDAALRRIGAAAADPQTLVREDFPLPSFTTQAAAIRRQLWRGRGFVVLRGLPADRYNDEEMRTLYWGICTHLGVIVPQTVRGDRLYSVRDEGYDMARDYGTAGVRTSKTRAAIDFHTDSPARLAGHTPDVVGLLVLRPARAGGESALVSGPAVHNVILRERPDLLDRLYEPFWMDRRIELPPGEAPVVQAPVFAFRETLQVRFLRLYIEKGHEMAGMPLTEQEVAALNYLGEVARRPALTVAMDLQRGDIQLLNNIFLLHSREQYEDHPEPERKRHYVRIWLVRGPEPGDS